MLKWNRIADAKIYSAERAELLVLLEGSTRTAYVDSVGDATIGIGFNLVYNLEPVLRVIIGNRNWSDTLYSRLKAEVDKNYTASDNAALRANLDRVMRNWHETRDDDVPDHFRFKDDAQVTRALDRLAPDYDARIDGWLAGIPQSREREALFSLCWNAPGLLGPKLRSAIEAGDRAEAWYEIRYNSNGNGMAGLANRRYVEAETFGLFDRDGRASFAEARDAGQMFARHRETVLRYEKLYDPEKAAAVKDVPGIDAIGGEMAPAVRTALKALGLAPGMKVEELLAVAGKGGSLAGDGTGDDTRRNDNDLILGSNGGDALSGGAGRDILAGLKGADTLTGGAGADLFVFSSARDSRPGAPDTVTDFGHGADRLAFAALGELTLIAEKGGHFTGDGSEIRWFRSGGDTIVEVDTDGDRIADMRIVLDGRLTLDDSDFLL